MTKYISWWQYFKQAWCKKPEPDTKFVIFMYNRMSYGQGSTIREDRIYLTNVYEGLKKVLLKNPPKWIEIELGGWKRLIKTNDIDHIYFDGGIKK